MAGFRNVPHGKVEQFLSRLGEAGLNSEAQVDSVNNNPALARAMVDVVDQQRRPESLSGSELFIPPIELYGCFSEQAALRKWPFTPQQLEQLRGTMPADHESRIQSALALDIWFGDAGQTFDELWQWNISVHDNLWRIENHAPYWQRECVGLLHPERYGATPSVRWVELDLTAHRGCTMNDRQDENLAGLQLLAAAALHPEWPRAMNGNTVPYVHLNGLRLADAPEKKKTGVPSLEVNEKLERITLDVNFRSGTLKAPRSANPTFRDL